MLAPSVFRPAPPPIIKSIEIPAPIGGINALDAATALPVTDCLLAYNLTAAELGLRVRLGWSEWAVGLAGAADSQIRTILPFSGSHKNGSTDKLFGVTTKGIWDITSTGAVPTAWANSTTYQVGSTTQAGSYVTNGGNTYVCAQGGVSAASPATGPSGTGTGIVDGGCLWNFVSSNTAPSLLVTFGVQSGDAGYGTAAVANNGAGGDRSLVYCDEENGLYIWSEGTSTWTQVTQGAGASQISGVNPATFAAVCVWKSRLWFIQKDTTLAWYLGTNAIFGAATSFDFAPKLDHGGPLANLYNWSYDAGGGMDTLLVAISTAGDVTIYQGTDPSSVATFGIVGSWNVGGVPYGRNIALKQGGDILVMSLLGVVPLSKLVVGQPVVVGDRSLYQTEKITPLFNLDAQSYQSNRGWAIGINPGDNALMCLVPANGSGVSAKVYAMSFSKRSWSVYRDLPIISMAVWNGTMYFGTADGRVAKVSGYQDGVLLNLPSSFTAIGWSFLTGFTDGGSTRLKQVLQLQPIIAAQEPSPPVNAEAKYDLDITEAAAPTGSGTSAAGTWDNSTWDTSTWGGSYEEVSPIIGGYGMGRTVAVAVRGQSASRTSISAIGISFQIGGFL